MKRIIAIVLTVLLMAISVSACTGKAGELETTMPFTEEVTSTTEEATTTTATTEPQKTAQDIIEENDCVILCCGEGKEDSEYYLVANQKESYDSVTINVGVIKNDEWLVPLSNDSPLLSHSDKNDSLVNTRTIDVDGEYQNDSESEKYGIEYVADGCFACEYQDANFNTHTLLYNVNTGKDCTVTCYNMWSEEFDSIVRVFTVDNKRYATSDKIVVEKTLDNIGGYSKQVSIIDTNTMEEKVIIAETGDDVIGPYVEGMFAMGASYSNDIYYFCDAEGKQVLDVKQYADYDQEYSYFRDGEFTYTLKNSAYTPYRITIDKTGKVIDEEELSN